ncbi:aminotransferase-like domain-containing protein [Subtercola endophyticus]|uniref:aminotransferase-like domain-containing protein n=1 Tax=Subtercola endophyticus TaxID=2895559 RepID=UPI001E360B39|nr:PLP-dependent aminotransferase family protein [Subtercola endophyticus]UFS60515.1 PLP-dependent aminotransferase family protein [Subtercola endophyticus]
MNNDSTAEIERHLRALVTAASAGDRLPSTRALVAQFAVSPLTVQSALHRLAAAGLIETRPGTGTFVSARPAIRRADFSWQTTALASTRAAQNVVGTAMSLDSSVPIAMHSAYPSEALLPQRLIRQALGRAARRSPDIDRPLLGGMPELRAYFASEIDANAVARASGISGDDTIVVPGSQSALISVFRALAQPGDAIVMESPTYWGAIAAARQAGLVIVPIARGSRAPAAAELDEALETSGARLFYAQPHFANPTGALWSSAEAASLLEVIRARNAFLIEDDWAHDFGIDADVRPLLWHDTDGHVVYLRSLSKSVSPSLRVGAVIARGPALARIQVDRTVTDLYVSGTLQAAALDVVTDPGWRSHLVRLREALRVRRDTLAAHVVEHLGAETLTYLPKGGLNLWLRFDDGVDVARLVAECLSKGVSMAPGGEWYPAEPPGSFVRLNFSGPHPERFGEGVEVIAEAIRSR